MKLKYLSFLILTVLVCSCTNTINYSPAVKNSDFSNNKAGHEYSDKSLNIYVPKDDFFQTQLFIASNANLSEKVKINLGEYAQESTYLFFQNYFQNVTKSNNLLDSTSEFVVRPELRNVRFGLKSKDALNVDGLIFVKYVLGIKIYKKGDLIFNDIISNNEPKFSENTIFFKNVNYYYEEFGKTLQLGIYDDLQRNMSRIINLMK